MENNIVKPGGVIFKQLAVVLLIMIAIYLHGGVVGLAPFLHVEAVLLVFGGTFLLTWTAFPVKEIFHPSRPGALRYAAGCAIGMGVLATLLDLILALWLEYNTPELIKHLAPALAGLFYGFLLSKVILSPIAARLE